MKSGVTIRTRDFSRFLRVAQILTGTVLVETAMDKFFEYIWRLETEGLDIPDHARLPSHDSGEPLLRYFVGDEALPDNEVFDETISTKS